MGILFICLAEHFLQKKKEKEEECIVIEGEKYYLLGGSYTVQRSKRYRILSILPLLTIYIIMICLWNESILINYSYLFCLGCIGTILLSIYCIYSMVRPKIDVRENKFVYYPKFRKAKEIDFSQITYRYVEDSKFHWFTIFSNNQPKNYKITYYNGLEELLSITTNIPKAQRFDTNVVHHMKENGYIKDTGKEITL